MIVRFLNHLVVVRCFDRPDPYPRAFGSVEGEDSQAIPLCSWEDLRDSCGMYELKRYIASTHHMHDDLASFICEFTNERRTGNEAAHTAECRDIRAAIC